MVDSVDAVVLGPPSELGRRCALSNGMSRAWCMNRTCSIVADGNVLWLILEGDGTTDDSLRPCWTYKGTTSAQLIPLFDRKFKGDDEGANNGGAYGAQ